MKLRMTFYEDGKNVSGQTEFAASEIGRMRVAAVHTRRRFLTLATPVHYSDDSL
jgi:hypothetical protein